MSIPKVIVALVGGNVNWIDVQNADCVQVEVRQYHKDFQEGPDDPEATREWGYDGECRYEVIA